MSDAPVRLALRTAFEALRAGVPNRAAVRLLGSVEDAIEERFESGLGRVWPCRNLRAKSADLESVLFQCVIPYMPG